MRPLRAGVIGLGVGEQHIAGYREHSQCEVVAVCDTDPEKLAEVQSRHPELVGVSDPVELLDDSEIDVVSIASYDDAHHAQIMRALANGKHVFVEKPLVLYENELQEVRAMLASKPELNLSCNVPLRRSPRFGQLRDDVQAGELGELFHFEGDYDYGRRHKLTHGWRGYVPHYSVVLGGAIHMVDLLLWITGDRVTEVSAYSSKVATRGTRFKPSDFVIATMRMRSGATAKVTANLGCVSPHFHGVRIYGTEGTFINGIPNGMMYRPSESSSEAEVSVVDSPYPGVHKGALIHGFVEQILTGKPSLVTADEVFETLAVCFAIERAHREGKPVRLGVFE